MNNRKRITVRAAVLLLFLIITGCATLTVDAWPGASASGEGTGGGAAAGAGAETPPAERAGTVTVRGRTWNWLFRLPPETRLAALEAEALKEAREVYGPDAEIRVEKIASLWHPLSLVMLLDLLGYVEETGLSASVWIPGVIPPEPEVPEAPPLPPLPEKVTVYRVVPGGDYIRPDQFTWAEYKSPGDIRRELEAALNSGKLAPEEYQDRESQIPPGGEIGLHIGRTELENAISRWFQFTLMEGTRRIFRRNGQEDIPYVPGRDQLWWNDLTFEIKEEWESPLEFIAADNFLHREFRFSIIREVRDAF